MEDNRSIMAIMGEMKTLADDITLHGRSFIGRAKAKAPRNFIEVIAGEVACAIDEAIDREDTGTGIVHTLPCGVEICVGVEASGDVEVEYYHDNDWRDHGNVTGAIEEAVLALPDLDDWEYRIEKKQEADGRERELFELDYCRSVV